MRFVDLDTAKSAPGLRLVLIPGVPSPWSQAAKAIVDFKGIDALAVWKRPGDEQISAWTGIANAPVALYASEPPRAGWAEILALTERLAPTPTLVPRELEPRVRMFGLCHELMGELGVLWNMRLLALESAFASGGTHGWTLPIAQYLAARYGYAPGCGVAARAQLVTGLQALGDQLERGLASGGPYYFGSELTALDIYSAAALDTLLPLPHDQCPMHPRSRAAFEARGEEFRAAVAPRLVAHRDLMHQRHMPLPIVL
jgi:glutathione S-transferase